MNIYIHLGLDDAKDEMIRLEELEQERKEIDKENGILYNLMKLGRKKIPGLFLPLYCNVTILHSPTHMRKNM